MSVTPLGANGFTPRVLLEKIAEIPEHGIDEMFCVVLMKDGGVFRCYSGGIKSLAWTAALMQSDALNSDSINGCFDETSKG